MHCYIEYNPVSEEAVDNTSDYPWRSFGGHINPGRDYQMFEKLAGVRGRLSNAVHKPRGVPPQLGYAAQDDNTFFIIEDGEEKQENRYIYRSKAMEWVKSGSSVLTGHDNCWVTNPDWHSHSWLTLDEFREVVDFVVRDNDYCLEYKAMVGAMEVLANGGRNNVRVVFWFDN